MVLARGSNEAEHSVEGGFTWNSDFLNKFNQSFWDAIKENKLFEENWRGSVGLTEKEQLDKIN